MIFLFLAFAALAAALFGYFVWRKGAPALVVLAYEKAGTPPKSSRLKNEWVSAARFYSHAAPRTPNPAKFT